MVRRAVDASKATEYLKAKFGDPSLDAAILKVLSSAWSRSDPLGILRLEEFAEKDKRRAKALRILRAQAEMVLRRREEVETAYLAIIRQRAAWRELKARMSRRSRAPVGLERGGKLWRRILLTLPVDGGWMVGSELATRLGMDMPREMGGSEVWVREKGYVQRRKVSGARRVAHLRHVDLIFDIYAYRLTERGKAERRVVELLM